jgi:hypothetical protein
MVIGTSASDTLGLKKNHVMPIVAAVFLELEKSFAVLNIKLYLSGF